MKIIKAIQYNNDCFQAGRKIDVQGLMLHSVGCNQPDATVFVNSWDDAVGVGVHAFIDGITGDVYQCLPWNHRAWHCGSNGNNTHIGIEMCEPESIIYYSGSQFWCSDKEAAVECVKRTYNSAVKLFAELCVKFGLNPYTDIISHKEGYEQGIASNHGDPEHLWDGLKMGYTMNGFRMAVADEMIKFGIMIPPTMGILERYKVVIAIDELNVRAGAGTDYPVITKVYKNDVYTIVEEAAEWGKLKSGIGWIYLPYTERI